MATYRTAPRPENRVKQLSASCGIATCPPFFPRASPTLRRRKTPARLRVARLTPFRMAESREAVSGELILCFALRHLGDVRELLILKVKGNNFYLFLASAIDRPIDVHITWHESGQSHVYYKINSKRGQPPPGRWVSYTATPDGNQPPREVEGFRTKQNRVRPSELKKVGRLLQSGLCLGQFPELPPVKTHEGESVVLDAEAANFTDDFIAANVYLVEPGAEDRIPIFPCIAARLLHLDKRTTPWLAVELFQAENVDGAARRRRFVNGNDS